MTILSNLIRKNDSVKVATATVAISAIPEGEQARAVAKIATVAVANPTKAKPPPDREAFQERAGIMEFSGGIPRPQAEFLATCDQCRFFTRFANCSMPREAGLTFRFELIQAPGQTCQIFERRVPPAGY